MSIESQVKTDKSYPPFKLWNVSEKNIELKDDPGTHGMIFNIAKPYRAKDPKTVAPRRWLYGDSYMRETLTIVGARGGVGKTSLEHLFVYDMVTGALNVQRLHKGPLRVCFVSLEDSQDELERRFEAIRKHYNGSSDVWGDRLTLISLAETEFKVTKNDAGRVVTNDETIDVINLLIGLTRCDVLIFDPLVHLHHLPESDNTGIAEVARRIIAIAMECDIAIGLIHHAKKNSQGQNVDIGADDLRGAGSLADAARIVRMVTRMTEDEAEALGVPEAERWRYIRRDDAKVNYSPENASAGVWFKKVGVDLGNALDGYDGDNIGVIERAVFTPTADDITPEAVAAIRSAVASGDHRGSPLSKDWAGIAIGKALGLDPEDKEDKAKIIQMIKRLINSRALALETRKDNSRRDREFIVPGPTDLISPPENSEIEGDFGDAPVDEI